MKRAAAALLTLALPLFAQATPKSYDVMRANKPLTIDGNLNDKAWKAVPWSDYFVDIVDDTHPKPWFKTRIKLLYDDKNLYIAAEMEESNVTATLTRHDSVIFHDNDFELFLKPPLPDQTGYFEFEINALNTSWDLYLNKRYLDGGKADNAWEIPGLQTGVQVQGTLNKPADKDKGWTVEIAIPWESYKSRQPAVAPKAGDVWRANFSRVEWKTPGVKPEENWVWTPQGKVNMHLPDKWGYLRFQ